MSENLFRYWLLTLMVGLIFLIGLNVFAQSKAPPPISIDVIPRGVFVNEYQSQTFRIRWKIQPHEDNRSYTLAYDCGEYQSTSRELDQKSAITHVRTVELLVTMSCVFVVCVARVNVNLCARQEVHTLEGG